jgi:transcriptional regulator with XRE-family HTH domain
MTFAGLLSSEMKRADLSDAVLAEKVGVTRMMIHSYRTGRREPSLATYCRIVAALPALAQIAYSHTNEPAAGKGSGLKGERRRDRRSRHQP